MAEQSPPSRWDVEARLTAKAWKDAALSDAQLEAVAGGSGGLMQLVAYGFPESK